MNFYKMNEILLENKHIQNKSLACGHCNKALYVVDIIIGKWMYPIGQLYSCKCEKSKIFTNTIRNIEQLINFIDKKTSNYRHGFCNDKRCGHCFGGVIPLENGVDAPKEMEINKGSTYSRADRYGCLKCKDNQNILKFGGDALLPEGDKTADYFKLFYSKHKEKLKKLNEKLKISPINPT